MKTTDNHEPTRTESLYWHAAPALAWAAFLAFFAISGASMPDESERMANVAPAVQLIADENDEAPSMAVTMLSASSQREPAPRDPDVVAHEALDPVGVGLSTTQ